MRKHENYRELVWVLAKTDFKLRYHGSVLGYVWALLKPLLMFAILNFVFSSIFNPRGSGGNEYYTLQLLTAIIMFNFFSEGTMASMSSLLNKSQLVTKIYIPRWTIIVASTLNSALVYAMNLVVIIAFFAWYQFLPSFAAVVMFILFSLSIYAIVLAFGLLMAPLYVRLRDLILVWEVVLTILFYATPIIYPLQMLPLYIQQVLLANPMAFIIHFTKESLTTGHFAESWQYSAFFAVLVAGFGLSVLAYRKFSVNVAEEI
ncbi:MAG: ABC transporter permease [Candidatus Moranbacteria bacterium]|nr:ABC transporter permease [Candidatus Moranbacteria bacterium]